MEGISHEAIDFAGHMGLGRLVVLWDDNKITIDGSTDLSTSTDQGARFAASGWHVQAVDGHDKDAVAAAIEAARADARPSLIACRTIIGFGAPTKQGTSATHGAPLGDEEIGAARDALGWAHAPFEIPADVVECAETWQAALENRTTPTVLCLSRQGLPCLRGKHVDANLTAKGAYVLRDVGSRHVTLIATGSAGGRRHQGRCHFGPLF